MPTEKIYKKTSQLYGAIRIPVCMSTKTSAAKSARKTRVVGLKTFETIQIKQLLKYVNEDVSIPISRIWLEKIGIKSQSQLSIPQNTMSKLQASQPQSSQVPNDLPASIEILVSRLREFAR
jgi:hypothetical protein